MARARGRAPGAASTSAAARRAGSSPPRSPRWRARIDDALDFHPGHESTLEANPEDLDAARLDAWLAARRETALDRRPVARTTTSCARSAACTMRRPSSGAWRGRARARLSTTSAWTSCTATRGTTWSGSWTSLARAIALAPEHVSAYAFTARGRHAARRRGAQGERARGRRTTSRRTCSTRRATSLEAAGFRHYEISNFARPGTETLHHVNYWRRGEYLGLGPSAASFLEGRRVRAPRGLLAWAAQAASGKGSGRRADTLAAASPLPWSVDDARPHALFETAFLGLRLDVGMALPAVSPEVAAEARARWTAAGETLVGEGFLAAHGRRLPRAARGARADGRHRAALARARRGLSGPPDGCGPGPRWARVYCGHAIPTTHSHARRRPPAHEGPHRAPTPGARVAAAPPPRHRAPGGVVEPGRGRRVRVGAGDTAPDAERARRDGPPRAAARGRRAGCRRTAATGCSWTASRCCRSTPRRRMPWRAHSTTRRRTWSTCSAQATHLLADLAKELGFAVQLAFDRGRLKGLELVPRGRAPRAARADDRGRHRALDDARPHERAAAGRPGARLRAAARAPARSCARAKCAAASPPTRRWSRTRPPCSWRPPSPRCCRSRRAPACTSAAPRTWRAIRSSARRGASSPVLELMDRAEPWRDMVRRGDATGVRVAIGRENPRPELAHLSIVSYRLAGPWGASIGLLGPRRMDYGRAMSLVDAVGRELSTSSAWNPIPRERNSHRDPTISDDAPADEPDGGSGGARRAVVCARGRASPRPGRAPARRGRPAERAPPRARKDRRGGTPRRGARLRRPT